MSEEAILKVRNLKKLFPVRQGWQASFMGAEEQNLHAVDGVSFDIHKDQVLGLVGESGCGQSTLGRLLLRLIEPTSGEIYYKDTDLVPLTQEEMKPFRSKMQIIFLDP